MGCGGSRLGGVGSGRAVEGGNVPLPAGIRPLLRRRLEEMKKRSHASVLKGSHTLSKKELLRHGSSEDGEEMEENDDSFKASAKVAPAPDLHVEEKKVVIYEKVLSRDDVKAVKEEEEVVKKQEEDKEDTHHDVHDDKRILVKKEEDDGDDHGEERMTNFEETMICPGSPSFRVYCIDVTSDPDDDEEKDGEDSEDTSKSVEIESVPKEPKEDESNVKKEKRERKGKRFGMALPKKYLANVTAPCYAGGRCMGNNTTHSRLVQENLASEQRK